MMENKYKIEGDSAEYEYLTEAVELSKDVDGLCCEVGVRRGMGIKTIVDAVRLFCPHKSIIGIDPYGHIEYEHRENQITRLDYTNQMKNEALTAIYSYLADNPANFVFANMTDTRFFKQNVDGVEINDLNTKVENRYSMVHLDGPHGVKAILREIIWFNVRMETGATLVIDDISPDFVDMEPIDARLIELGWEQLKIGNKKALYVKK